MIIICSSILERYTAHRDLDFMTMAGLGAAVVKTLIKGFFLPLGRKIEKTLHPKVQMNIFPNCAFQSGLRNADGLLAHRRASSPQTGY